MNRNQGRHSRCRELHKQRQRQRVGCGHPTDHEEGFLAGIKGLEEVKDLLSKSIYQDTKQKLLGSPAVLWLHNIL